MEGLGRRPVSPPTSRSSLCAVGPALKRGAIFAVG